MESLTWVLSFNFRSRFNPEPICKHYSARNSKAFFCECECECESVEHV